MATLVFFLFIRNSSFKLSYYVLAAANIVRLLLLVADRQNVNDMPDCVDIHVQPRLNSMFYSGLADPIDVLPF